MPGHQHSQTADVEPISHTSKSGSTIAAWLTEWPDATGSILLLHAVHADRRSMADRLGVDANQLSPLKAIAVVRQPVLIFYGSNDRHAKPSEAKALFAAACGPKEIREFPGAAHVDLHRFAPAEYEKCVGDFLAKYLQHK